MRDGGGLISGGLRTVEQTRPFSYKNGTYPAAKRPADGKYVTEGTLRKQAALLRTCTEFRSR